MTCSKFRIICLKQSKDARVTDGNEDEEMKKKNKQTERSMEINKN
jgi:hypothetical protein